MIKDQRFWIVLFVIGMGCIFILNGQFGIGVGIFLFACYLSSVL